MCSTDHRSNPSTWCVESGHAAINYLHCLLQDNMGETVDVLVVGKLFTGAIYVLNSDWINTNTVAANYGSGKRGGGVSTLICAVLDDRLHDNDDEEPKYGLRSRANFDAVKKPPDIWLISDTAHSFALAPDYHLLTTFG
jgi:hypothetical protein